MCDQLRGTPLQTDAASLRRNLTFRAAPILQEQEANGSIQSGSLNMILNASFSQVTDVPDEIVPLLSRCFNVNLVIYQINGNVLQHFMSDVQPPAAVVRVLLRNEH